MPAVAKDSDGADEVSRRVKAIEDFAPKDTLPPTPVEKTSGSAQALKPVGPKPKESTERQKLKTIVTFAVPFKRDTDYVPPDWRKEREARKRAGVTAVRLGAAILTFFTLGIVGLWLTRTPDAIPGDLISWMPAPIEVALTKLRNPNGAGPPGLPLALPSNLKLPDFDKPPKHTQVKPKEADPDPTPPKKIDPPKPLKNVTPPPPKGDCYAPPPNGPQATLTVELARSARVELDGVRVCGVVNKLPVSPGKHLLRIVDGKSKQEWKSTMQFEAGKQKKVSPNFR